MYVHTHTHGNEHRPSRNRVNTPQQEMLPSELLNNHQTAGVLWNSGVSIISLLLYCVIFESNIPFMRLCSSYYVMSLRYSSIQYDNIVHCILL